MLPGQPGQPEPRPYRPYLPQQPVPTAQKMMGGMPQWIPQGMKMEATLKDPKTGTEKTVTQEMRPGKPEEKPALPPVGQS